MAASLRCFAMVNYDCRLEHLPLPPDTRARVVEEGVGVLKLHSTLPCAFPLHYLSLENRGALCTPIQGYTC